MTNPPVSVGEMPKLHQPVMLQEMLDQLEPRDGEIIIDGTFGQGGYSRAILARADCRVLAFDRDPYAAAAGRDVAAQFPGRFELIEKKFSQIDAYLTERAYDNIAALVLDLGVSSPQIDQAERGFSFRFDGPLDMRMGGEGQTAADLIAILSESDLADLIYHHGDERHARRIARAIVTRRQTAAITRTGQLADLVRSIVPRSKDGIDPATRTFQALRLVVNDEMGELERILAASLRFLQPGGRLLVVSFHSAEDGMVKLFLRQFSPSGSQVSRHMPMALPSPSGQPDRPAFVFRALSKKPILPCAEETKKNPRARSARMRVAVKFAAAAAAFPATAAAAAETGRAAALMGRA
ncbi:MAG: 16S rRNA (cytosine(1402)-N(4))-methyltransferase RsmH [Candidatus Symbiobacter sp.]|nr:16S rRNA (cytosine(1402)-N(4))-methyltransferase RsmH [Candidatus Symbiobacter sp.]